MFGMANQLLAVIALTIVTTVLVNSGRARYTPVTLIPVAFVATTTTTTGYLEITGRFLAMTRVPATAVRGWLNIGLTAMLLVCAAVILASAVGRWVNVLSSRKTIEAEV
jgi:carbon starvation protein